MNVHHTADDVTAVIDYHQEPVTAAATTTYSYNAPVMKSRRIDLMPPLLVERVAKYDVSLPNFAPVFDRILVYPLEAADQADKIGSIVVPTQAKDKFGAERGLIIAAGARAHEELYSHGIEVGHIVVVAKFSPWRRSYATAKGVKSVLMLRSADIVGSEDVETAYQNGTLWLERDASTGQVEVADRGRIDPSQTEEGI